MSINTTANTAGTTKLNKTFYDRQLLESAKTRFVHAKYGQKRPIPKNSGKRVEFRKWNLFDANDAMEALQEGVTPASQALSQSNVEVEVAQYGAYVEVSDLLDMTGYDQVISESAELLGEQLGTVVEWVTRDAMNAGTNVQYANGKSGRGEITAADKLTVAEIRKAVRTLKKAKARPFGDEGRKPHFICICSPEATYDLQSDSLWQDVSKYSCAEQIYSGEIGRLFGVVFVESTEAKVFSQSVLNKVKTATSSSKTFVLKNSPKDAEAAYLSTAGNKIKIGTAEYTVASFDAATNTVTLSDNATLTADAIIREAGTPATGNGRPSAALANAIEALEKQLSFVGWVEAGEVYRLCAERDISVSTIRRARVALGLKTLYIGNQPNRKNYWYQPELEEASVVADITNQNQQIQLA